MLISLESASIRQAMARGWIAGFTFFASTLYWIAAIRELGELRIPALIACAAVLGCWWSVWAAAWTAAGPRRAIVFAAPLWASLEIMRGTLFTGFPWTPLGASQWKFGPLFLAVRFVGIHGISALIVAVNAAAWSLLRSRGDLRRGLAQATAWAIGAGLLAGASAIDLKRMDGEALKVCVMQGNFDEEEKNSLPHEVMLERYEMLAFGCAGGAALHVWPETATGADLGSDRATLERIQLLAKTTGAAQLVGALLVDARGRYCNGAFLVTEKGISGAYFKRHLVPFGEYVPGWVKRIVPLARKLTEGLVDFSPGRAADPLALPSGEKIGALICYEAIFPAETEILVDNGAELLVNVTNDAWYRRTAASYQHALGPITRAVEFGRYVVRCANTGVSLVADPHGRILVRLDLFETGAITADVRSLGGRTWYCRWRDWPIWFCLVFSILPAFGLRSRLRYH